MKIIEVARQQKDLLNEGIAYVAVWQETTKNGKRSWNTEDIFPDGGVQNDEPVFSDGQKARLAEIAALDADAVLLNGWLHSWIGSIDEPLTAAQIADGIRKHYEMHNFLVSGYLADGGEPAEADEPEANGDNAGEVAAPTETEVAPDHLTIEMPMDGFSPESIDRLCKMVSAKEALLKTALGTDDLPISVAGDKLTFPWFFGEAAIDGDHAEAYATLVSLLCKTAKEKKRVTAKAKGIDGSPKYAMRCFLLSLGMIGDEYKKARKILLSRLEGNSSWKNGRKAETEEVTANA